MKFCTIDSSDLNDVNVAFANQQHFIS